MLFHKVLRKNEKYIFHFYLKTKGTFCPTQYNPSYSVLNYHIGNNGFIYPRHVQSYDSLIISHYSVPHISHFRKTSLHLPLICHVLSQLKLIISIVAYPEMFLSFYSLYYCPHLAIAANKRFLSIDLFSQPPQADIRVSFSELCDRSLCYGTNVETRLSELVLNI